VSVDLQLSDAMVDLIGEGFDAAIRLAVLPDSSLVARRLCEMPRYLVGSPTYLDKHGRPRHPLPLLHRLQPWHDGRDMALYQGRTIRDRATVGSAARE
jgi:DNA-binding transcriptional LysR family regulator